MSSTTFLYTIISPLLNLCRRNLLNLYTEILTLSEELNIVKSSNDTFCTFTTYIL